MLEKEKKGEKPAGGWILCQTQYQPAEVFARNALILSRGSKLVFSLDLQRRGQIRIVLLQLKPRCFGSHLPTLIFHSRKSSTLIPAPCNPAADCHQTAFRPPQMCRACHDFADSGLSTRVKEKRSVYLGNRGAASESQPIRWSALISLCSVRRHLHKY